MSRFLWFSVYFTMGRPPRSCPFRWGYCGLHLMHRHPKQHLDWFSRFYRARQWDRPTDHTTPSVTVCHIYVCSTVMWPNNTKSIKENIDIEIYANNNNIFCGICNDLFVLSMYWIDSVFKYNGMLLSFDADM